MSMQIGCFISPHGHGHATRSIAVLEALHDHIPGLHPHLFTTVSKNLFKGASFPFTYHHLQSDIGLIHHNNLAIDVDRTIEALSHTIPYEERLLDMYAEICGSFPLIYCDISALGIEIAARCSVPSLLVENFTWDWIYKQMAGGSPALSNYADLLSLSYAKTDYHIQTEPVCTPTKCDLTTPPIARKKHNTTTDLARHFNGFNHSSRPLILITMGGIPLDLPFLHLLEKHQDYFFIIAGQPEHSSPGVNIRLLGNDTDLYHPDLIDLVDLVICKAGYSTIAECAQTSTPICCIKRTDFAESAVLESYVLEQLNGTLLEFPEFIDGSWLTALPDYLKNKRKPIEVIGSSQAAAFIYRLIGV